MKEITKYEKYSGDKKLANVRNVNTNIKALIVDKRYADIVLLNFTAVLIFDDGSYSHVFFDELGVGHIPDPEKMLLIYIDDPLNKNIFDKAVDLKIDFYLHCQRQVNIPFSAGLVYEDVLHLKADEQLYRDAFDKVSVELKQIFKKYGVFSDLDDIEDTINQ